MLGTTAIVARNELLGSTLHFEMVDPEIPSQYTSGVPVAIIISSRNYGFSSKPTPDYDEQPSRVDCK